MIWNLEIRTKAVELRKQEKTYPEICQLIGARIPKGTLSYWFRKIEMSEDYYVRKKDIETKRLNESRKKALLTNRNKLERRLRKLKYKNRHLSQKIDRDVGVLMLLMLYWAEGAKYPANSGLRFGNSDPKMIKLFLYLLRRCFAIDESKIRGTVQCRADQDGDILKMYWSRISGIPLSKFQKTFVDKRTFGKKTRKADYKGVFVINYFNTDLQLELQFLGEYIGRVPGSLVDSI